MPSLRRAIRLGLFLLMALPLVAQQFDPSLYQEMRWRMIGPFRGGRTVAATGVLGQPNLFYIAAVNGGVWRSNDAGRTWTPIFDGQPSGSVGALAVAPSNPEIIYVGSGEGLRRPDLAVGDGIYKSSDGGKSWQHLGLRDGQQIGAIIVDPKDPNRVLVGVNGHPYGPNAERGVFRSLDGGQSWQKVLYKDENTGAVDLAFDPQNAQTVYAVMWASRRPPWSTGNPLMLPGSGLFKSTDGGSTWRQLTKGLPGWEHGLGRIGIGMAPSNSKIIYAMVEADRAGGGVYRSNDGGESWQRVNTDRRVWGRGSDFAMVRVDPKNPDVIYVANTSTYKSTDGGKSFTAWKGAPGGDDYHTVWINPDNPEIILLASDQGATITVNGGQTWSSWYNQPTAQFYHVITDKRFPYWVYGAQQESGSVGTASRSDDGEITFREWHTVGTEEYGYIAPDPLDPNILYGGRVTKFDWTTKQVQDVSPIILKTGKYRFNRTAPLIFSPADPHALYYGTNVLFKTTDGGKNWQIVSPDLTRPDPGVPPNLGPFAQSDPRAAQHRGVIYTVAPSPKDANLIWAGTDDGLIRVTRDGGKNWQNVTPSEITPWNKLAMIEASHFDGETAYAAVNRLRLDDLNSYIYRTHDGGKSWQKITNGLPNNAPVNTVREDPEQKGLLFCGTETSVYVSFDDGDNWQSLQLNLPATSMRDLTIHGDDLIVGTHGRSFWILDDITPLRQLTAEVARANAFLFKPQLTYRMRRDNATDTPLPPETPAGQNPPDGAVIDYFLKTAASEPVTLEITDANGNLVRRYSSADKPQPYDPRDYDKPMYWARPLRVLSAAAGMHRWIWDLHCPPVAADNRDFPISAIPQDTPLEPLGPRALPGPYTIKLTVNGQSYTQPLTLQMDPRVRATAEDLRRQFEAESKIAADLQKDSEALQQARQASTQLDKLVPQAKSDALRSQLNAAGKQLSAQIEVPAAMEMAQFEENAGPDTLASVNERLTALYTAADSADAAPTTELETELTAVEGQLGTVLGNWEKFKASSLAAINQQLAGAKLPSIEVTPVAH